LTWAERTGRPTWVPDQLLLAALQVRATRRDRPGIVDMQIDAA
jgi:hypothetical protein